MKKSPNRRGVLEVLVAFSTLAAAGAAFAGGRGGASPGGPGTGGCGGCGDGGGDASGPSDADGKIADIDQCSVIVKVLTADDGQDYIDAVNEYESVSKSSPEELKFRPGSPIATLTLHKAPNGTDRGLVQISKLSDQHSQKHEFVYHTSGQGHPPTCIKEAISRFNEEYTSEPHNGQTIGAVHLDSGYKQKAPVATSVRQAGLERRSFLGLRRA